MEETSKSPFWKPALIYGAIVGFIGILLSVIFYIADLYTKNWANWVQFLIAIIVLIYCLSAYRKEHLGGYASYGQIFLMALVIGVISSILSSLYSYILFTVIDPELVDKMRMIAEERIINNPRIPESYYDAAMERLDKQFTVNRMVTMGLIFGPVLYAIVGLIAAAFLKKEEETGEVVL
jgi:cation transport ATPase